MTRFIAMKCPQCGADLSIEEGRKTAYCSYCGAKVMIENENEHVYRHIDEAEIKRTEAEERIRMRELDLEEAETRSGKGKAVLWAAAVVACIATLVISSLAEQYMITLLFMSITVLVGMAAHDSIEKERAEKHERMERRAGKIKMPMRVNDYDGSYASLKRILKNAGFHNIVAVNLQDVMLGLFVKSGTVANVTIDGEEVVGGRWYYPDDEIVINYHGK